MQDLKDVTHDIHYENFRAQKLAGGNFNPAKMIKVDDRCNVDLSTPILYCFVFRPLLLLWRYPHWNLHSVSFWRFVMCVLFTF